MSTRPSATARCVAQATSALLFLLTAALPGQAQIGTSCTAEVLNPSSQAGVPLVARIKHGISFAVDDLRDMYALVAKDERTLITLSRRRDQVLILGRLVENGNFGQLYTFDGTTSASIKSPEDVELSLASASPNGIQRVVLLYRLDKSTAEELRIEVWLQTFAIGAKGVATAGVAEKVAETNYVTGDKKSEDPWRFSLPTQSGLGAAPSSEVRLFLRDVNQDGLPDLVVWTKSCLSKATVEQGDRELDGCPAGFRLDRRFARVKLATQEGWSSTSLRESKEHQPSADAWDAAFGSFLFGTSNRTPTN